MNWNLDVTDEGFEVGLKIHWKRLRNFFQNLCITIWSVASIILALKAAGIDIIAWISGLGGW
jgi:hypothetical protein